MKHKYHYAALDADVDLSTLEHAQALTAPREGPRPSVSRTPRSEDAKGFDPLGRSSASYPGQFVAIPGRPFFVLHLNF
ncbi:hypothetical protein LP417_30940 [Polaromonas sp. P1-6]|nr:hypothetical protein LP417_30940 [Polaromonas sp. P1-6]